MLPCCMGVGCGFSKPEEQSCAKYRGQITQIARKDCPHSQRDQPQIRYTHVSRHCIFGGVHNQNLGRESLSHNYVSKNNSNCLYVTLCHIYIKAHVLFFILLLQVCRIPWDQKIASRVQKRSTQVTR